MKPKFKLISSGDVDTFEARLNHFVTSLGTDDIIVDVKFSTSTTGQSVDYSGAGSIISRPKVGPIKRDGSSSRG